MQIPMTETENAKIDLRADCKALFGVLAESIGRAMNKHFAHLTSQDESMAIDIDTPDGQLTLDLGSCFGWDCKSETSPSIKISLIDLVREHLQFALWFYYASKDKEKKDRFTAGEAMYFAGPFREQLRECIKLIDAVEAHIKTDTAAQFIKPDRNPMVIHVDWDKLAQMKGQPQ
jgi:hypothetical protein